MADKKIFKMEELVKLARIGASGMVVDEARQSFPMPVKEDGQLKVVFFFYPSRPSPTEGASIFPPNYIGTIDAITAKVELVRAVNPAYFHQSHQASDQLGYYALAEGVSIEQYLESMSQLYHAYDVLIPYYLEGKEDLPGEAKKLAREFMKKFNVLSEKPLAAYYLELGKPFFSWVKVVGQ